MPITIAQMLQGMASSGEGASDAVNKKRSDQREAQLKAYLQGQEPEIAGKKQAAQNEANMSALNDPRVQSLVNEGGSAKVGDISLGGNPYAKMAMQGPHQAQAFLKNAQGAYKDINSNLDASQQTLDALNLGNSAGDKAAAISEAKLMLSGGRGIPSIAPMLSGDPTMASDAQKAMNWLQNTPNIPTLQPAQRDALREMIYNRNSQTQQQHQQASQQLMQQGPIVAPQSDYQGLANSFIQPAQQKIDRINKMQADYQAQRQKMSPQNPVSNPAQANANPSSLDRLKAAFSGLMNGGQGQQAPQQPQGAPQGAMGSPPQGKKISKKQYSKSLNQTRIVYDDGSMDTVNGLQQ